MPWRCFFIAPTNTYRHYLRRYSGQVARDGKMMKECPLPQVCKCHDFSLDLEEQQFDAAPAATCWRTPGETRWPQRCKCGYVFEADDNYQDGWEQLWKATGDFGSDYRLFPLNRAPIGAMWTAFWQEKRCLNNKEQPGFPLMVQTPARYPWLVDGPAANGPGWTRSGPLPDITVSPSIKQEGYHGFLQNGILTEDCEGVTFPGVLRTAP